MTMVRGSNPIWYEVDLTAHAFDDTFYMFVLENEIPYLPLPTWQDPFGNVEWTNPIRFLANGTLPNNIYFDPDVVYRLEFRQGDTQADPLIYLVENYVPGGSGSSPVDESTFPTDNQITNPQFSLISFSSPATLTSISSQAIEVAPDWFLNLTGTGNVTLTQVLLNSTVQNPTNASYALKIELSGSWTKAYLSQRFHKNGVLWSNTFVSSSITALSGNAPQTISAILVDSQSNTLTTVLSATSLTAALTEYPGIGQILASADTDFPPTAYIEYQLNIPINANITITSLQLISGQVDVEYPYEQSTIERQIDHTWHHYRDSVLMQPKESLLTGWNFGQNPWRFSPTTPTTPSNPPGTPLQCWYTADQTIIYQLGGGSEVLAGQDTAANGFGFQVTALGAINRFAMIQYIDPRTMYPYWNLILSSLVKAKLTTTHGSTCRFKMRLIWRTSLPPSLTGIEPISSWSNTPGSDPVFQSGWNQIIPRNDPIYTLGSVPTSFPFEGMVLPALSSNLMTLGIVIYTLDNLNQNSVADYITFNDVSLVPNEFSIASNVLGFDETLSRCQYYFESSKNLGSLITDNVPNGALLATQGFGQTVLTISMYAKAFGLQFKTPKRTTSSITHLASPNGVLDQVTGFMFNGTTNVGTMIFADTVWTASNVGNSGIQFLVNTNGALYNGSITATVGNTTDSYILYHFTNDARLGV